MNLNNSVVIAKVKSIYGKRIKKNQFIEMSNLKNIEAVTSYLKQNSNYNIILKDVDETNLHRGQLEALLRKQIFINQEKIFHYLNKKNDIICNLILEEYELSELLKLVLFINTKTPKTYRLNLPGFLISKCGIDLLKLSKIETFHDLLNFLQNTHYYKVLKKLELENESIDFAICERELYCHIYKRIFKAINRQLDLNSVHDLKKLLKLKITHVNISSVYRERIIFNSNILKIKKRILPFSQFLTDDKLNSLIETKTTEEFEKTLNSILNIKNESASKLNNGYIENFLLKLQNNIYNRLLHMSNNVSVVFYVFHQLLQIELFNLIYIIEGVRYGFTSKEIQQMFIL